MNDATRKLLEEAYPVREDNPKVLAAFRQIIIDNNLEDVPLHGRNQNKLSARKARSVILAHRLPPRFRKRRTLMMWWTVARAFPWSPKNLLLAGHKERTLLKFVAIDKLEAMSRLPELEKKRLLVRHQIILCRETFSAQDIKQMKVADLRTLLKK